MRFILYFQSEIPNLPPDIKHKTRLQDVSQIQIPDWLKEKINVVEIKKRQPVPDWLKDEVNEQIRKLQEEIDYEIVEPEKVEASSYESN
jgi:uncharacterized membrane protein YcaP (DUF421 family)